MFRDRLLAVSPAERDAWVDAQLGLRELPADDVLPRGAVPYLPCSVEAIIAMVDEAPVQRSDTFVDIGAGVGRVAMLVHLVTGARTHGIEIQASLVAAANDRRDALGLSAVSFTQANAAEVALDGSQFFLYAPCNGELLARVMEQLRQVAMRRPITVGAVDLQLDVPWLVARASRCRALTIYAST